MLSLHMGVARAGARVYECVCVCLWMYKAEITYSGFYTRLYDMK